MPDICVTNKLPGARPCVVRGEHRSNCDGHARRFEEVVDYDKQRRRTVTWFRTVVLDRECGGCLPREAHDGSAFCEFHARQAEAAFSVFVDTLVHLWSINGAAPRVAVGGGSGFGSRWTLTDSRIRANEIIEQVFAIVAAYASHAGVEPIRIPDVASAFYGFRSTATTLEVAAVANTFHSWLAPAGSDLWKRQHTAARVLPFITSVRSAFLRFPAEDVPHRVPGLRCRNCQHLSLVWHPPLYYADDDAIRCDRCGHVEDRSLIEHDIRVILELRGRKKA